jgi:hypothetical protein
MSHFETLVHAALQQQVLPMDQQNIDAIVFELTREGQLMLDALGRCTDEKEVAYYVKSRQYQLVRLMNLMMETNDDISKHIFSTLGELLTFLERDFPHYLDEDCPVPNVYLLMIRDTFMKEIEVVSNSMMNVDQQLRDLVMRPYRVFLLEGGGDVYFSYHEVMYLKTLLQELYELVTEPVLNEDLQLLLLQFDFNDPDYFGYLIEIVQQNLEEGATVKAKKDKIFWFQKYFDQVSVHPGMYLKKLHNPLKVQLQSWLSAELRYLNSYEDLMAGGYLPGELDIWKDFKVQTTLSVHQLGRLVGLMLTSGIILNENKTELATFFSVFFTSTQRDVITVNSVRNSFYNKSIELAKSIRDILTKLLNLSRE